MRTTGFSKVMIAIVFAMASVLTMNAAGPGKVTNVVFRSVEQPKTIRNIQT